MALLVLFLGTLYQWQATREVDTFILVRFGIILTGLLVMARALASPPEEKDHERCAKCGSRVFQTTRTEDRQTVLTCFACGAETRERPRTGPPGGSRPAG